MLLFFVICISPIDFEQNQTYFASKFFFYIIKIFSLKLTILIIFYEFSCNNE